MIRNISFTTDSGVLKEMDRVVIVPSCIQDSRSYSYLDQKEITNEEIYERRDRGEKFKTSSPIMSELIDTFEEQLQAHDEVIHFAMSSDISAGSVNAARQAAYIVDDSRIHVLDTRQGGPGGGLVVDLALRLLEEGFSSQDILEILKEEILPNIQTFFLVPNPIGFLESGRNSTNGRHTNIWKELAVKMLIRRGTQFEVALKDGKLLQDKMRRYQKEDMYQEFIREHLENEEIDFNLFSYGGTLLSKEQTERIENYFKIKHPKYEVVRHNMGGVIASYACKDTVGISYVKK